MKSCPKCNRTFPDEGQKFCTFDGGLLIAPQTFDPNATIRATSMDLNAATAERPTSRDLPDPNATIIESYPATVALPPRNTGPATGPAVTSPDTSDISRAQTPPLPPTAPVSPPPPPAAEQPAERTTGEVAARPPTPIVVTSPPSTSPSAPLPSTPATSSAPLPPPAEAKKKSKLPWIIAGVLLFLLLSGGALAGVFFAFVKPRLDEMAAERNTNRPVENVNASTPTPAPSVATPTPTPEDTYQPPSDAVQFVNSNEKLDGKLAEHYFDFSFYYKKSWSSDPKAGVAGATNFVKVQRTLPPALVQENFAVGWYTSTGTFEQDMQSYPQRVEQTSNGLAKSYPEYKKVSEGPTKVNSMDAYEFRWEGLEKGTDRGDVKLWGRVIFLPTGNKGDSAGAILSFLCTSLAPELSSVEDVGERGEAPVILESFRFGKKK
jgi:hypothetical protein